MALADINYYFCCTQPMVVDLRRFRAPFLARSGGKGTYFSNLSQSLSPYSRPPDISERKQYEDLVDAYEN